MIIVVGQHTTSSFHATNMFVVHVFEIALGCRPTNDFELVIDGIGNGKTTMRFDASVEVRGPYEGSERI